MVSEQNIVLPTDERQNKKISYLSCASEAEVYPLILHD